MFAHDLTQTASQPISRDRAADFSRGHESRARLRKIDM